MLSIEEHTKLNSAAILQLNRKVEDQMAAIVDLRAAEAELSAMVDMSVELIADLTERLEGQMSSEAEIKDIAGRLRNLKDMLSAKVSPVPTVKTAAPATVLPGVTVGGA